MYICGPEGAQRCILSILTNKNVALIYFFPSEFANRKQRIVLLQEASNINCGTVVFIIKKIMFAAFNNQSPVITMV